MRTTLTIDSDVLMAAQGPTAQQPSGVDVRNGVPLLPLAGKPAPVTLEVVNWQRDDLN